MPTVHSIVRTLDTQNLVLHGDPGLGSFWIKGVLVYNFPAAGISTSGHCNVNPEGAKGGAAPPISGDPLQLTGTVSPAGVFTTNRLPTNPAGGVITRKTHTIDHDGLGRFVRMVWETTRDLTFPNRRTIEGEIYLEYTGVNFWNGSSYTIESPRIPFTISVYT